MNIHSVSFFRDDASGYESENAGVARGIFFVNFLRALVRAHHIVWQGWQLRIHHDWRVKDFAYFKVLRRMEACGLLRLVDCGPSKQLCRSMLWRMLPVWDLEADVVVCRDVDSLPMHRDRVMVSEFIRTDGTIAHAILDSESHSGPLMGGMVGFKAPDLRLALPHSEDWTQFIQRAEFHGIDLGRHGADQRLLNAEIWPAVSKRTLIHQKRNDILYPDAFDTRPVAPKAEPLDRLVHCGAAYDVEKALEIMSGWDSTEFRLIKDCEAAE